MQDDDDDDEDDDIQVGNEERKMEETYVGMKNGS